MTNTILFLLLLISTSLCAKLTVIKPDFSEKKIELRIVQAYPDSWETHTLVNENGREMVLVCAHNRVYDDNQKAYLQYRNFYNEIAAKFTIENNQACKDLGNYINKVHMGISEANPFYLTLERKSHTVEMIIYPKIDPLKTTGEIEELLPKKHVEISYPEKENEKGLELN